MAFQRVNQTFLGNPDNNLFTRRTNIEQDEPVYKTELHQKGINAALAIEKEINAELKKRGSERFTYRDGKGYMIGTMQDVTNQRRRNTIQIQDNNSTRNSYPQMNERTGQNRNITPRQNNNQVTQAQRNQRNQENNEMTQRNNNTRHVNGNNRDRSRSRRARSNNGNRRAPSQTRGGNRNRSVSGRRRNASRTPVQSQSLVFTGGVVI